MITLQLLTPVWYAAVRDVAGVPPFAVRETSQTGPPKPRLVDRVREAIRIRHVDRLTGQRRRHHLHESVLQRAVKDAVRRAGVAKPASCHTFRHSFATHLIRGRPRHPSPADRMFNS